MSEQRTCALWLTKEKRTCGTPTDREYQGIPMCDDHRPSNVRFVMSRRTERQA